MKVGTSATAVYFILLTVAFTVAGQIVVKYGMLKVGPSPAGPLVVTGCFIWTAFTNPWVISGMVFAVLASVTWTMAVSRSDLTFAYPFMALAIVLVLALSKTTLGETASLGRWIGVAIVCLGVFVVARSS